MSKFKSMNNTSHFCDLYSEVSHCLKTVKSVGFLVHSLCSIKVFHLDTISTKLIYVGLCFVLHLLLSINE